MSGNPTPWNQDDIIVSHFRDQDGIPDKMDNCPDLANALQTDTDGDKVGESVYI